jgi:CBS domain-containing protein
MKKNVISIQATSTVRDAAIMMSHHHVGLLPVVDQDNRYLGMIGLPELLSLEMPAFFHLISDLDFVGDFGAVETRLPTIEQVDRSVTSLMHPALYVTEDSGLLLAYAIMLKHNLTDLPVVSLDGKLIGIVSRVDIGTTILKSWKGIKATIP